MLQEFCSSRARNNCVRLSAQDPDEEIVTVLSRPTSSWAHQDGSGGFKHGCNIATIESELSCCDIESI